MLQRHLGNAEEPNHAPAGDGDSSDAGGASFRLNSRLNNNRLTTSWIATVMTESVQTCLIWNPGRVDT